MKLHRESVETGFLVGAIGSTVLLGFIAFTGIGPKWLLDLMWKLGGGPPTYRPDNDE